MGEGDAAASRVLIVMPTYNERQNLEIMAGRVREAVPDADLLVVDDNSPDGTGDLADKLAEADPHVQVMHRTEKAGLGRAYVAGFTAPRGGARAAPDGRHPRPRLRLRPDRLRARGP